jgi:hypothetical protein
MGPGVIGNQYVYLGSSVVHLCLPGLPRYVFSSVISADPPDTIVACSHHPTPPHGAYWELISQVREVQGLGVDLLFSSFLR